MPQRRCILTKEVATKKLIRMAYEIVERNTDEESLVLAGIRESGFSIATMIYDLVKPLFKGRLELLAIDIDKKDPHRTAIKPVIELNNRVVILIDDVANSGRTILYAIKPFLEYYPKKIQTLVLVERTHKQFPVLSDYVGLSVSTTLLENIIVEVNNGVLQGGYLE